MESILPYIQIILAVFLVAQVAAGQSRGFWRCADVEAVREKDRIRIHHVGKRLATSELRCTRTHVDLTANGVKIYPVHCTHIAALHSK